MSLTIRAKLTTLVVLGCLFMTFISVSGLVALKSANEKLEAMYSRNMVGAERISLIGDLMRGNRIQLLLAIQHDSRLESSKLHDHDVAVHLDLVRENIEKISKLWDEYATLIDRNNPEAVKLADDYKVKRGLFVNEGLKPCIAAIEAGNFDEAVRITLQQVNPFSKVAIGLADDLRQREYSQAHISYQEALATYHRTVAVTLVLITFVILFASIMSFFTIRGISRSTTQLARATERMANGDLVFRVEEMQNDELGRIAGSFNTMADAFGELIGKVSQSTAMVATASSQVLSNSQQMSDGSEEVASQAGTVATASEEMTATSQDIASNCHLAAESANLAAKTTQNGFDVVRHTVEGIRFRGIRTKQNAQIVSSLGERSNQIGAIVGTIEDIADQTNLLALNAAIEAARAGEQGRGFAVVADEVRALAERTTKATKEISGMIKAIQAETQSAIVSMEEGVKGTEEGAAEAEQMEASLQAILDQVTTVTMQISQIATAAEEQTATTSEISRNMLNITDIVQQTAQSSHDTATAANRLNDTAMELQRMVGQFKL